MSEIAVPDHDAMIRTTPRLSKPEQVNISEWTGGRQFVGQAGLEIWLGRVELAEIATEEDERPWRAFLYALGRKDWFEYRLPCNQHDGSMPTVGAGAGNAYTLPLAGLAVSRTILRAGQFMTVPLPSGRMRALCLIADLVSNSSGTALAQVRPALSEIPNAGITVETFDPFVPMSPMAGALGLDTQQGVSGTSFDVEEFR